MVKRFPTRPLTEAYEKVFRNQVNPWIGYAGNKRKLIPVLMGYLPSPSTRFVDMFGGTGITGANAYKFGKCELVVYNDLEYDMVLLLEWMHVTPIDEIVKAVRAAQKRWRDMIASLTPEDVVFLDPPYMNSDVAYNKSYNRELDIYLFAFCQLLNDRRIPWIMTNNLSYDNAILKDWIKGYYAYKTKKGVLSLYTGRPDLNANELIVSNFKPPMNRKILSDYIEPVFGDHRVRGLVKWSTNGVRE